MSKSHPSLTWIGNKHKHEFHRVEAGKSQPLGCQLDEIPSEHKVTFSTAHEALTPRPGKKAYDPCKYCTKKFKSRH